MFRCAVALVLLVALRPVALQHGPDNEPSPPFRIADGLYYVGSRDMASLLVATPEGHVLIDAGYPETVPIIRANVAALGLRVEDVRILLNTQAHFDHAGGFAAMKALTGARLMVSEADADVIERGGRGDFLFGDGHPFPPARVDRRLRDGDQVRLGGAVLTAHVTGGHTKGCTTWTFDVTDKGRTYHVVDIGGTSVLDGMRLGGMATYPSIGTDFERTFRTLKALSCDIFLGAHASYFDGQAKAARLRSDPDGANPFVDPDGCRAFVRRAEERFIELRAAQNGRGA